MRQESRPACLAGKHTVYGPGRRRAQRALGHRRSMVASSAGGVAPLGKNRGVSASSGCPPPAFRPIRDRGMQPKALFQNAAAQNSASHASSAKVRTKTPSFNSLIDI